MLFRSPLNLLLQRAGVQRVDDVPVIDSFATTVKMAEMLVSLKRSSGMSVTRQGYFYAQPSQGRIDELLKQLDKPSGKGSSE